MPFWTDPEPNYELAAIFNLFCYVISHQQLLMKCIVFHKNSVNSLVLCNLEHIQSFINQLNNVVIDIESSRLYAILTHLINTN